MKKFSVTDLMNKHFVFKESLLATVFTIIVTWAVSFIPIKYEFSKAIRVDFLGFDIYDLYYSGKHLKNSQRDTDIVIVQVANDRDSIAAQINLIQKYTPKVIGIDAVFNREGEDHLADIKLVEAISKYNNIILASRVEIDSNSGKVGFINNFFEDKNYPFQSGYINFLGNKFSVIRNYPPFYKTSDSVYMSFSTALTKIYSPEKFAKLKKRRNKTEIINYTGNLESYTNLSKEQLAEGDTTNQLGSLLRGKIVLLGYFVKESPLTPLVIEDLHFSPVNERISGKSYPDMYGVVMHANILSMVLNENYVSQASELLSYFLASLIIFLFLFYMLSQYKKKQHPKHGKFLLIQFLLVLFVLYLFLQVFNLFNTKIPLLPIMIAVVLCVELLGVYKNIALWMHKKYEYKTVFAHKHII
jgi:CHASE2 domain-containing sensor protein